MIGKHGPNWGPEIWATICVLRPDHGPLIWLIGLYQIDNRHIQ